MRKMFLASPFYRAANLLPKFHTDLVDRKVCLLSVGAAADPALEALLEDDRGAVERLGMVNEELEISTAPHEEIRSKITGADFLLVCGATPSS